ncbi:MAG TPA: hypothetical protein VMD59_15145, partial [Acidimicrobiales bacterium]|nr:hypothetical protein [Acidimicrobiales bacterium]
AGIGPVPLVVTADHIYVEARVKRELTELGVKRVVIPRPGRLGRERRALEHKGAFGVMSSCARDARGESRC